MITRIVKLTLDPSKSQDFEKIFTESENQIRNSPGCLDVKMYGDIASPGLYFTISIWENAGFLEQYRASELFTSVWPKTKALFVLPAEAWSVEKKG